MCVVPLTWVYDVTCNQLYRKWTKFCATSLQKMEGF